MKVSVSVLIPIKNEAANLPRCLASVAWADEIVVVDSQSTDGSQAIAGGAGARVVQFAFNGVWPKKKNWALENIPFRNEWVFILDADEVLPPEAEREFAGIIARDREAGAHAGANANGNNGGSRPAGYWINRRFMFMGRWLRHAYYPNWNLRLFKHRLGRYERLVDGATNSGDNEVHEHIVVRGTTARLDCEMDHYAFPSVEVFVEKHNRYSNWEAALEVQRQRERAQARAHSENGAGAARLQSTAVKTRRRLRELARRLPFRPTLRFLYVYLVQGGILDGAPGYYFARLHATYELLTLAKVREMKLLR